jgi:hypothetical protein
MFEDDEYRPCAFEAFPLVTIALFIGQVCGFAFACGVSLAFNLVAERALDSDAPERTLGAVAFSFGMFGFPLALFAVEMLRKREKLPTRDTLPLLLVAIGFGTGVVTGFGMLFGFDIPTLHHTVGGAVLMTSSVLVAVAGIMLLQCYREHRARQSVGFY